MLLFTLKKSPNDEIIFSSYAGSIPTTAHVVIALGKQFTYNSSVHPPAKWAKCTRPYTVEMN